MPTNKYCTYYLLSDAEKVLAKKEHQYGISVEVYNETAVEGKLDNRRFILTGFNETCKCDIVSLYIGSCSQGAEHVWETLDDGERVVVTFKQDIGGSTDASKICIHHITITPFN